MEPIHWSGYANFGSSMTIPRAEVRSAKGLWNPRIYLEFYCEAFFTGSFYLANISSKIVLSCVFKAAYERSSTKNRVQRQHSEK
jgi:hypothetical protein